MTLNAKALEAAREVYEHWQDISFDQTPSAILNYIEALETALSSLPQAGVSEPLTSQERFLLEWLGKEESSALGECSGCDLDVLINRGFAVIAPAPEGQHRHFCRVSLTDAGRATLSCQQEEAVPVATMHRSDTEILFSKGYVPNMLGFTSSPLYASPVPADAGEPTEDERLFDADEPMADGEIRMTAAENVLGWLLVEKIGVPDDRNYSPNEAQEILARRLDYASEMENECARSVPATSQAKAGGED